MFDFVLPVFLLVIGIIVFIMYFAAVIAIIIELPKIRQALQKIAGLPDDGDT